MGKVYPDAHSTAITKSQKSSRLDQARQVALMHYLGRTPLGRHYLSSLHTHFVASLKWRTADLERAIDGLAHAGHVHIDTGDDQGDLVISIAEPTSTRGAA